jgi:hypothetical protein
MLAIVIVFTIIGFAIGFYVSQNMHHHTPTTTDWAETQVNAWAKVEDQNG